MACSQLFIYIYRFRHISAQNLLIGGEEMESENDFCYLRAVFTDTFDDTKEIKRRIAVANNALVFLGIVSKSSYSFYTN